MMRNRKRFDKIIVTAMMRDQDYIDHVKNKDWRPSEWGLPQPNVQASYLSLGKYNKRQPFIDVFSFEKAVSWMKRTFSLYVNNYSFISFDEALCYVERSSSPGYPWSAYGKTNGEILDNPEYVNIVREAVNKITPGDIDVIWKNALKEEVRPKEKIRANKIRTFTAAPLHFTIYCIMHCHGFNDSLFKSALKHPSVVGFDTYRGGWHQLYLKLKRLPNAFEADVSEYDSSLFRAVLFSIGEFRYETSLVKDPSIFVRMYDEIVNSVILTVDGNVVQKTTGNPSGSYNTIVDNTLALYMLFAYVFITLHPSATYSDFCTHVEMLLCGDDNSFTVSDDLVETFNITSITTEMAKIGVRITSPHTNPVCVEEIKFLSRSFNLFANGICLPLLDRDKMLQSLKWNEYAGDPVRTLERISGFLNVAWPDRDFYNFLRRLQSEIIDTFDPVLSTDLDWIVAKASFLTEQQHQKLFIGESGHFDFFKWELSKDIMPIKNPIVNMEKQAKKAHLDEKVKGKKTRTKKQQQPSAKAKAKKQQPVAALTPPKLAPKGLTKAARKVIEAIALPQVSDGLRISSGYNDAATAVDSIFEREPIRYGTDPETSFFSFRSALRNCIRSIPLSNGDCYCYGGFDTLRMSDGSGTSVLSWHPLNPRALSASFMNPRNPGGGLGSIITPHGPYLYPGRLNDSDGRRGYWFNVGDVPYLVAFAGTPTPNQMYCRPMVLKGQEWVPYGSAVNFTTAGLCVMPAISTIGTSSQGSYMCFDIGTQGTQTGAKIALFIKGGLASLDVTSPWSGTLNLTSSSQYCYGHRPLKSIESHFAQIDNLKIYGNALLYTQTSAFTSNQGEVAMAQVEGHKPWWDTESYSVVSSMNPSRCHYMPVTNGSYVFLKPSGSSCFNYLSEFITDPTSSDVRFTDASGPSGFVDGAFQFYPTSDFLVLILNQDTSVNRSGLITVASTIEYETEDIWVETRIPSLDPAIVAPAIASIRHLPQFHENEFHISDVFNWLKDKAAAVVNGVLEYGPMVLKGAAMAAPFLL